MSGAASSLTHFSKLLHMNTMSFSHQLASVIYASKDDLPKSRLQASTIAASLSFNLIAGHQSAVDQWQGACANSPPVELPELHEAVLDRLGLVRQKRATGAVDNAGDLLNGRVLKLLHFEFSIEVGYASKAHDVIA